MKKLDESMRMGTTRMAIQFLIGVFVTLVLTGCSDRTPTGTEAGSTENAGAQDDLTPAEAGSLAKEAWLFGLPLVMFEKQFDYGTYATKPEATRAPVEQFVHYRKFVDASNRSVVGFNVDNLYSFAGIDLAAEPIVLSIPAIGDRFWLMQIIDAWNGVPEAPGSRTHGARRRMIS